MALVDAKFVGLMLTIAACALTWNARVDHSTVIIDRIGHKPGELRVGLNSMSRFLDVDPTGLKQCLRFLPPFKRGP